MSKIKYIVFLILLSLSFSCEKNNDYEIEYQNGYPSRMAGNWVVFEFPGGELLDQIYAPYDLVTALDPNSTDSLVIDNLYNSRIRVKVQYTDTVFSVYKGRQLEVINNGRYNVEKVSITGRIQRNEYLAQLLYEFALRSFKESVIEYEHILNSDLIYLNAGLYDSYDDLIDTLLIMGYRHTGFEEVDWTDEE